MVTKADEKWDTIGDNPLVIISEIRRMMDAAADKWAENLEEFLEDEDLNSVLDLVTSIIAGNYPDQDKIANIMVRLESYNIKFRTRFSSYMGQLKGTTDANAKKNHYKEIYTGIDRLVDSLKYMLR